MQANLSKIFSKITTKNSNNNKNNGEIMITKLIIYEE
jgi:hypothetical protein